METQRRVELDLSDERQEELRKRGIFFIDGEEVNLDEAGCFYRDMFFLIASGWPKEKPIWVVVNTPGGSVHHGLAIHDTIALFVSSGYTVNTFGLGLVASMGTVIIGAGKRRYGSPHTQFLLHQVSEMHFLLHEEATQAEERAAEMKRINVVVMGAIAKRIGMDLAQLSEQVKKKDFWIGAEEAKQLGKHGLIDEVCVTFPFMSVLEKE